MYISGRITFLCVSEWNSFIFKAIQDWHGVIKTWLRYPNFCLYIIQYEDLVNNIYEELLRLAVFLGVDRAYLTPQHVQCVLENARGKFKRQRRTMDLSVFTKEMDLTMEAYVKDVEFVAMNKKKIKLKIFR